MENSSDKSKNLTEKNLDEKFLNPSSLKKVVKENRKNNNSTYEIPQDILEIKDQFLTGRNDWDISPTLKIKKIKFSFVPSGIQKQEWMNIGITRLKTLLRFLIKEYGDLDSFDLIFYRNQSSRPFYLKTVNGVTQVYVDFNEFQKYTEEISKAVKNLQVSKYYWKVRGYFQKKVLTSFFENEPASSLINELKTSYLGVIEEILNEYENMPENEEKKDLRSIVMQSKLARDTVKEISELTPESPEKQLMMFCR